LRQSGEILQKSEKFKEPAEARETKKRADREAKKEDT